MVQISDVAVFFSCFFMPPKADNFAIFNDAIGVSKQYMGRRGRLYQIINVGRNKRFVIMCDDHSEIDISVRCFKKAGVSADWQLVFNLMMEDISFHSGSMNLGIVMNSLTLKKWTNKLGSGRYFAWNL